MSQGKPAGTRPYDVVGLGASAIDELVSVAAFPRADSKIPVLGRARRCGGIGATSLVAAARLGSRVAYAGILDDDDDSRFVVEALRAKGVDTTHVHHYPGAGPVLSVILIDETRNTRTILYDLHGMVGPEEEWLPAGLIKAARVLLVDYLRPEVTLRAARFAREHGVAVVADLEDASAPGTAELMDVADHLVVSGEFAAAVTRKRRPAAAVRALAAPGRTVVVTCGADGAWYMPDDGCTAPVHVPAFTVDPVDTNGCGDVFHGAYAAALARDMDLPERVRVASAVAALSSMTAGGQEGIPDLQAALGFIESNAAAAGT
jgi:sulfofructose kinase